MNQTRNESLQIRRLKRLTSPARNARLCVNARTSAGTRACRHPPTRTKRRTNTNTQPRAHRQPAHAHAHAQKPARKHAQTHTDTHRHTQTHRHTHTRTHARAPKGHPHVQAGTHTHTRTHTLTHALTHTHTRTHHGLLREGPGGCEWCGGCSMGLLAPIERFAPICFRHAIPNDPSQPRGGGTVDCVVEVEAPPVTPPCIMCRREHVWGRSGGWAVTHNMHLVH